MKPSRCEVCDKDRSGSYKGSQHPEQHEHHNQLDKGEAAMVHGIHHQKRPQQAAFMEDQTSTNKRVSCPPESR